MLFMHMAIYNMSHARFRENLTHFRIFALSSCRFDTVHTAFAPDLKCQLLSIGLTVN